MKLCEVVNEEEDLEHDENELKLVCGKWYPKANACGRIGILYGSGVFRDWFVSENRSTLYDVRIGPLALPDMKGKKYNTDDRSVSGTFRPPRHFPVKGPWASFEWMEISSENEREEEEREPAIVLSQKTTNKLYVTNIPERTTVVHGGYNWGASLQVCADHGKEQITCFRVSGRDSAARKLGTTLASGGYDGTIKIWYVGSEQREGLESCACTVTIEAHDRAVDSIAFHSEKPIIVSASSDRTIRLWTTQEGQLVNEINFEKCHVTSMRYVSDSIPGASALLACGTSHGSLLLWDVRHDVETSSSLIAVADHEGRRIVELDVSVAANEGNEEDIVVAAGFDDGQLRLYRGLDLEVAGCEAIDARAQRSDEETTVRRRDSAVTSCSFCNTADETSKVSGALFAGTLNGAVVVWSSACLPFDDRAIDEEVASVPTKSPEKCSELSPPLTDAAIGSSSLSDHAVVSDVEIAAGSSSRPQDFRRAEGLEVEDDERPKLSSMGSDRNVEDFIASSTPMPRVRVAAHPTPKPDQSSSSCVSSTSTSTVGDDVDDRENRQPRSGIAGPSSFLPSRDPCLNPMTPIDRRFLSRAKVRAFAEDMNGRIAESVVESSLSMPQLGSTLALQNRIAALESAAPPSTLPVDALPPSIKTFPLNAPRHARRYNDLPPFDAASVGDRRRRRVGKQISSVWLEADRRCAPTLRDLNLVETESFVSGVDAVGGMNRLEVAAEYLEENSLDSMSRFDREYCEIPERFY